MWPITQTSKGVGLRSEHIELISKLPKNTDIDFLELAPENWMSIGGEKREYLQEISKKYPLVAHGLSLSIGDCQELNIPFIEKINKFLNDFKIDIYSDHLSMSRDKQGYLYDLLPIPRRKENIRYIADRINCVQDIIQRPLVLENISYYHSYKNEMPESEFISNIISHTDCKILLDINNIYVNSKNHNYCPYDMIKEIPINSVSYYHIAGHIEHNDLLIDTHGTTVQQEVINLAKFTFLHHGSKPLLLERDNNLPSLDDLVNELNMIDRSIRAM
ncbi:DUF692 domain-containing protein [Photobacterium kishitanii]|uniref:DUF692 domain-containing protein n=1 Tax=Photobacterium kishitanii TaxID=318456 RepID=UPI0007F86FF0|nr:DUF692 domain-containing protein [Photobacterium kishitanii]OBU29693.1 hypothetical protein AYY23_08125 [Photobacterium kishitanii]PSW49488.1 DUF692 domain-containing protein [Photobacterium kishitanii]